MTMRNTIFVQPGTEFVSLMTADFADVFTDGHYCYNHIYKKKPSPQLAGNYRDSEAVSKCKCNTNLWAND
jgi:hypothetical protein